MSSRDVPMLDASQNDIKKTAQETELDEKYPNRPRNFGQTLPFSDLYLKLFDVLNENRKKPTGPIARLARKQIGPHGPQKLSTAQVRRLTIERFIQKWRDEVGNDVYPAFRLILPDKDRDRPMYGLKETSIAKLLVKTLMIDPNSDAGQTLLKFRLPGSSKEAHRAAGDFAWRCYEVIKPRERRREPTKLTIAEVNEQLDKLSSQAKAPNQLEVVEYFYRNMNATDMMWLIRIILRQMKVGATERTIFDVWHPDATDLYNVSSSLRRVCWELWDPNTRLASEDNEVAPMSCFCPQLAQFQASNFQQTLARLRPTPEDDTFWIEEKLDGERMQMHMVSDPTIPGGKRFGFWSRRAKDYTYIYGNGFEESNSALTRHLRDAFDEKVENCILDGEMITWDPQQDKMVPFGTLKTAAQAEQHRGLTAGSQDQTSDEAERPMYCVFDILYLNGKVLTPYSLRDRRRALELAVTGPVHRRFQIHPYTEAHSASEIEPIFRKVVEEESEGLVLKNPRSPYQLNVRCDDWMKIKPDYVGFGETPDVVVIGGYYGAGRRGGNLSSFLCGLRVDDWRGGNNLLMPTPKTPASHDPQLCYSFCRVGGGMTASDYAAIRHATDGKWKKWDPRKPPSSLIQLAGDHNQIEAPDMWIAPEDSIVLAVQASSVAPSDSFKVGWTLRFPRFSKLRADKDWKSSLSIKEFFDLKESVEERQREKDIEFQEKRRQKRPKTATKELRLEGAVSDSNTEGDPYLNGVKTTVFNGLVFYIMSGSTVASTNRPKPRLESIVKAHGGTIVQTAAKDPRTVCIAEKNVVHAAALARKGDKDVLKPQWLFDCIDLARKRIGDGDGVAGRDTGRATSRDTGRETSKDTGKATSSATSKDKQKQSEEHVSFLLPPEPVRHLLHTTLATNEQASPQDKYGDSYARDTSVEELRALLLDIDEQSLPESVRSVGLEKVKEDVRRMGVDF